MISICCREGPPPWPYTDDTEMALGIVEVLRRQGCIEQDDLADIFAHRYGLNLYRGYGARAYSVLEAIGDGESWQTASGSIFDGMGSMGNGFPILPVEDK